MQTSTYVLHISATSLEGLPPSKCEMGQPILRGGHFSERQCIYMYISRESTTSGITTKEHGIVDQIIISRSRKNHNRQELHLRDHYPLPASSSVRIAFFRHSLCNNYRLEEVAELTSPCGSRFPKLSLPLEYLFTFLLCDLPLHHTEEWKSKPGKRNKIREMTIVFSKYTVDLVTAKRSSPVPNYFR